MDLRFVGVVIGISLVVAFIAYFIQKKTAVSRKALYITFGSLFIITLITLTASYFIGGWTGLGLGIWSIYIGAPSLTTVLLLKLTETN
ncbi:YesK-like protein [Alkalibacterium subtropicum]|uniref:YesK-like protein n=1 Tax=Alkalibacterium subtropicum TaxID=753702 RepID=A0A1I1HIH8_9LACT|nr:YesK family protein [Alkalibacterium subtropicum]SFC23949.1 YesK-like protein [Alkalibacterium subtropicum]